MFVDDVRKDDDNWNYPTEKAQVRYCHFTLAEAGQEKMKIHSFTEHPEVGGEGEVGGDDMEDPAHDAVARPNLNIIKNENVPDNPEEAAK